MMRSRLPRSGFASIAFPRQSRIASADSGRMPTWPIHSSSVRREQKSCAAFHRRSTMRLSRILRFLKTIALTKIRRVVYVGDWGQTAGKGTELPGCWTSNGISCPRVLGVLRYVDCHVPDRRDASRISALMLLGPMPVPPDRLAIAFRAIAHCCPPICLPALKTVSNRIAL